MALNLPDQPKVSLGGSSISSRDTYSVPQFDQSAARNAEALSNALRGFGSSVNNLAQDQAARKNAEEAQLRALHAQDLWTRMQSGEAADVAMGKIAPSLSRLNRAAVLQAAGNLAGNKLAADSFAEFPDGLTDSPEQLEGWYAGKRVQILEQYKSNPSFAAGVLETLNGQFDNHYREKMAKFAKDGHEAQKTSFSNFLDTDANTSGPVSAEQIRLGDAAPPSPVPFNTAGSPKPEQAAIIEREAAKAGISPADYAAAMIAYNDGKLNLSEGGPKGPEQVVSMVKGMFPNARITDLQRDPNSRLGRANPKSFHISGRAMDLAAIPGVTFDQFVSSLKAQGLNVVEAIDEYKNPSGHATGGHWHIAWGPSENNGRTLDEVASEFTSVLQEAGAKPGMGYVQLASLFNKDVRSDVEGTYAVLAGANSVLTGSEDPDFITASGRPIQPGKAPDAGVHADQFPDDIITDPEIRNIRIKWMERDRMAGAGLTPQMTRSERRDLMVDKSLQIAMEKLDPRYLAIVPDRMMTDDQRNQITQARQQIETQRITMLRRKREEDEWGLKSSVLEKMATGQRVNPFEAARGADGRINPDAYTWITNQIQNPPETPESKAATIQAQAVIEEAALFGKWDMLRQKYPSLSSVLKPGATPSWPQLASALFNIPGINPKDLDGLVKAAKQAYDNGPVAQNPAFERGYDNGPVGIMVKNYVQSALSNSKLFTPGIEGQVKSAYDNEIRTQLSALGRAPAPTEMSAIIKEANAAAKEVFDAVVKQSPLGEMGQNGVGGGKGQGWSAKKVP